MKATKPAIGLLDARKLAAELSRLLRCDAARRLGLAEAFPQAVDRSWTPEFYRQCQLAERLLALLDEILAQTRDSKTEPERPVPEDEIVTEPRPLAKRGNLPSSLPQSRRRLRV